MSLEIEVDIIDKLFDEGIDLYELEEKVEKLIKANNGIVRSVEQLENKHKELSEGLYGRNRSMDTLIENIFNEIKHLKEDNAFLEKRIRPITESYYVSENPPITKDMRLSVSTESEKDNDLISFIREQIKCCSVESPINDVNTVRLLKKSILEQLLLDYSARMCKHVDEL